MRVRALLLSIAVVGLALLASGCDWSQLGAWSSHTNSVGETSITTSNVSTLAEKFTVPLSTPAYSQPAVANGVMYIISSAGLDALSANGTTDCSGTPTTCTPLWTGQAASPGGFGESQTPAVVDGKVFVFDEVTNQVLGFDAAGKTNCSGTPTVCTPVWQAAVNNGEGQSVTVSNGVLYVISAVSSGGDVLEAFDASGTTNCSGTPTTCSPLWTSNAFGAGSFLQSFSVSVSNGVAYVLDGAGILAFDANGVTDCSGSPTVCSPLWQYSGLTASVSDLSANYAVIAGSTLFVDTYQIAGPVTSPTVTGALDAFDANGVTDCSGTPKVCTPLWQTGAGTASDVPPTVADGLVYVPTAAGPIAAFDVNGSTNCSGTPKICAPVLATSVSAPGSGLGWEGPAVVGGDVLYAAPAGLAVGATGHAYAFDATGSGGSSPLWSSSSSTLPSGNLTIANGMLYLTGTVTETVDGAIEQAGIVEAYGLPS